MSIKLFALSVTLASFAAGAAFAQPSPSMVRKYGDWGLYSYKSGGGTTCYVLTTPQKALPASVDHGDNYFLVAPNPSGGGFYPQAIMGYDLKGGSAMELNIDGKSFAMMPKGNSGWTDRAANDTALIDAMKSGSDMTLHAVSGRGTPTSYTFSLSGISAALDQARRCN